MGNEQSKKPEPLPRIARRDYHAPFPPKHKIDYKDPRNLVLPKELPAKALRPVKKKFEPIPGIPEEEENDDFTDTDRNSNVGSVQNLNFLGLTTTGSLEALDKENSVPNGFTLGNGVLLNGHAPMIGNGEVQGRQKKKNPAPPPPPPPPFPGANVPIPPPPLEVARSNSTTSLNSQAPSQTSNHSAENKIKKASGANNVRRFSEDMKTELIDQVRSRMKRPPKKQEPIEKPKTPLEIFQSELASVSAKMEEKRASKPDWDAFEKKSPIIFDVGYKPPSPTKDDITLGAEIQILSLNNPPDGKRRFRKHGDVAHARSADWVPEHDLKPEFEQHKDEEHPNVANLSTEDEVMYRSGLQFRPKEPSLASARHYRSRSAEGEERQPPLERRDRAGGEERKSSYRKYSNSLRAFKRNMQQMFNSLGKSSISSKERGSVLDLFEDQDKLDDLEDDLDAMDDIDEEEIDLRQRRRVTFSQQPAQTREVVYYPGERDMYHRRFSEGYYPPMYSPRRAPPAFDPWYDESMRYMAPPPYRFVDGPVMMPDRRMLEMDYYRQMEDFHFYNPNSPSGMFYGRYGSGAAGATSPPTEKKKGKLSLRSRRRKLIAEARMKRQMAEEILVRDLRERQRMKNDKVQKKEYNANWEMLRDDIQYDSGLVSSRIRPTKRAKERIHHRSRSAPAATETAVDSYWEMYNGNEAVAFEGHARNVDFPDRTGYNEFEGREYRNGDEDASDERLHAPANKEQDDVTAFKNPRRRAHAQKHSGDVVSSSSDENKPPPKVLKSVLDEFDDIINNVPRDYSSSSEDEAAGGEGGLGAVVKPINTSGKFGNQREDTKQDASRRDDVAL